MYKSNLGHHLARQRLLAEAGIVQTLWFTDPVGPIICVVQARQVLVGGQGRHEGPPNPFLRFASTSDAPSALVSSLGGSMQPVGTALPAGVAHQPLSQADLQSSMMMMAAMQVLSSGGSAAAMAALQDGGLFEQLAQHVQVAPVVLRACPHHSHMCQQICTCAQGHSAT